MSKSRKTNPDTASPLSHINARGEATMVDVSAKDVSERTAIARGCITMSRETLMLVESGRAKKGDVLATARIAGIMAAKKTADLIPLCHPLAITKATVDFDISQQPPAIKVSALVKVNGQTGVEMEALSAVAVACLTIYDMLKAADKAMRIEGIYLAEKTGGRSGHFKAPASEKDDGKTGCAGTSRGKSRSAGQDDDLPPWDE